MPNQPKDPYARLPWRAISGLGLMVAAAGIYAAASYSQAEWRIAILVAVLVIGGIVTLRLISRALKWLSALSWPLPKPASEKRTDFPSAKPVGFDPKLYLARRKAQPADPVLTLREEKIRRLQDHSATTPEEKAAAEETLLRLTHKRRKRTFPKRKPS